MTVVEVWNLGRRSVSLADARPLLAEFVNKLERAIQELEEALCWLELLIELRVLLQRQIEPLHHEANELVAILVTSVKTAKRSRQRTENMSGSIGR